MSKRVIVGLAIAGALALSLLLFAGGKPSKGTPRDMRLKENKQKAAPASTPKSKPTPVKKGGA